MKRLYSNKKIVIPVLILCLIIVLGGTFALGNMHALKNMSFRDVTPTQMASAMREDNFWHTYRDNTLVFSGTVSHVAHQGKNMVVTLKTQDSYSVSCQLIRPTINIEAGNTIRLEAETYQAERQPGGVLLHNCIVP